MELLTYKDSRQECSYYIDSYGNDVMHGETKLCRPDGQVWCRKFYYHGEPHGEYRIWGSGCLTEHFFYINGDPHPYVEMNDQEKLLFQIQYPGFRFIEN